MFAIIQRYCIVLIVLFCSALSHVQAVDIDCTAETSLSSVISCVKSSIQPKDTGLYSIVSDESTHVQFYHLIQNITSHQQCESITVPSPLSSIFKTKTYLEDETNYCLVYTYQDVNNDGYFDDGHGVYIINLDPNPNPISVVVPHPLYDTNTPALGITVFTHLKGHVFSIAGAHRHTNDVTSSCQSSYKVADSVHNVDNFFLTFHTAIDDLTSSSPSGPLPHVEFHSMGSSTCPGVDVFVSSGFSDPPDSSSPAAAIYDAAVAAQSGWVVSFPDAVNSGGCNLYGTTNTVGRMMNGVARDDLCTTAADKATKLASSVFVQVELKWDFRSGSDWAPIMAAAFPPPTSIPSVAPTTTPLCTTLSIESGYQPTAE
mmetsp:Transcript_29252/g.49375  ORF Transcript_29252/g.49375 Transcript_29252/m.49375 type:complete len:372 (-) Transcript_29252:306-1421(-)